jgi:hypothetical protein
MNFNTSVAKESNTLVISFASQSPLLASTIKN